MNRSRHNPEKRSHWAKQIMAGGDLIERESGGEYYRQWSAKTTSNQRRSVWVGDRVSVVRAL
jgi:hypothetical protein